MYSRELHSMVMRHSYSLFGSFEPPRQTSVRRRERVPVDSGVDSSVTAYVVQISPDGTPGGNPAFDVTPARLVTGLITERGICEASPEGLAGLFPERVLT